MKKLIFTLVLSVLCSLSLVAQEKNYIITVHKTDNTTVLFELSDIDSLTIAEKVFDPFNGHAYVDLGLPSGTLWATCNVGATEPEEYGDYYAWGETQTKSTYDFSFYKWWDGDTDTLTKYCTDPSYGKVDNKTTLDPEDDAAQANWGGNWRMPTFDEQEELLNNCTWNWTTLNGVNGYEVRSITNGNSIFLPAAGCRVSSDFIFADERGFYWCSWLYSSSPSYAYYLGFFSDDHNWDYGYRVCGQSVRAVVKE